MRNPLKGDMVTFHEVYKQWSDNSYSPVWCMLNFVNEQGLKEAKNVKKNLEYIVQKTHGKIQSCGTDMTNVQKSILSGFFMNRANRIQHTRKGNKYIVKGQVDTVFIPRKSTLFTCPPQWVVYQDIFEANHGKQMYNVTKVEPDWLDKYQ